MAYDWKTEIPGIYGIHADGCPKREGGRCICGVLGYRAIVRDADTQERVYSPVFNTKQSARSWSSDRLEAVRDKTTDQLEYARSAQTTQQLTAMGPLEAGNGSADASIDELRSAVHELRGVVEDLASAAVRQPR